MLKTVANSWKALEAAAAIYLILCRAAARAARITSSRCELPLRVRSDRKFWPSYDLPSRPPRSHVAIPGQEVRPSFRRTRKTPIPTVGVPSRPQARLWPRCSRVRRGRRGELCELGITKRSFNGGVLASRVVNLFCRIADCSIFARAPARVEIDGARRAFQFLLSAVSCSLNNRRRHLADSPISPLVNPMRPKLIFSV